MSAFVEFSSEGEAPTINVAVGYSKSNTSPIFEAVAARRTDGAEPEPLTAP